MLKRTSVLLSFAISLSCMKFWTSKLEACSSQMDFSNHGDMWALFAPLLLLLLTANRALDVVGSAMEEEPTEDSLLFEVDNDRHMANTIDRVMDATLHEFRVCTVFNSLEDDVGFWVKPRSTTWFSRFLLEEYGDDRWIQLFRMTKLALWALADVLKPFVEKKDTKYRFAIPVVVRVACVLFKLTHGCSLFICSELFAIGKSTVSMVLREVVQGINVALRHEIS